MSSSSNEDQEMKDVQITLVDCFVSNADDENNRGKDDIGNEAKRTRIHHGAGKRG